MIDPLFRVRQGLILLAAVFLLSVVSFHVFADFSWLEAVWLVVVTFSTVGYGERPNQPVTVQLLTILVIVGGVSALGFTSAMLVQGVLDRDFAKALGVRKLNKRLAELKGHVVICGCGRLGSDLASQLSHRNIPCVALDCAESFREIPMEDTAIVIHGDATSEELLMRAGIERARTIVCALPSDADNVFVTLTARNLAPDIQIIARAEQPTSCKKLRHAGADKIVMPHHNAAQQMERMISRPTTADLLESLSEATNASIELEDLTIPASSRLVNRTLGECRAAEDYHLIIVGLRSETGEWQFNPPANTRLAAGDCLIVIGSREDIGRFRTQW